MNDRGLEIFEIHQYAEEHGQDWTPEEIEEYYRDAYDRLEIESYQEKAAEEEYREWEEEEYERKLAEEEYHRRQWEEYAAVEGRYL